MFIPIRDDEPTYKTPILTIGLIAVNTLVYVFSIVQGPQMFRIITVQFGYIPLELVSSVEQTPQIPFNIYLTPFTSMFMHGGFLHLAGNMLFLWIFGNNIEDYFGRVRFILFYLMSGLAAVALYTLFSPHSVVPLVGASGAIAGLMGGYMVLHPQARVTVLIIFFFIQFVVLPAKVVLGVWFAMQLLFSMLGSSTGGGVAWMAHVGGFVFGWGVVKLFFKFTGRGSTPSGRQRVYKIQW